MDSRAEIFDEMFHTRNVTTVTAGKRIENTAVEGYEKKKKKIAVSVSSTLEKDPL